MKKITPKFQFSKIEQATINKLLKKSAGKKFETAQILKENINITDKFIQKETAYRVFVRPKGEIFSCQNSDCPIFNQAKSNMLFKDATYIHYHPIPLPLSMGDILMAFTYKLKKIIAVFDDGRYSVFCPNKNSIPPTNELIENNQKIREIVQNLGEDYILKTPTILSKYKSDLHNFLKNLAKKTNSKYFSTM